MEQEPNEYYEKDGAIHKEDIESRTSSNGGIEPGVTGKTWVVIFCMMVGFGLSFFPVPLFAAVQNQIAAEWGDPLSVYWLISAWTLAITVAFMIGGANTDLLGRRWFLVLGNLFSFIGSLVIGTAKSGGAGIAGMTILGFGAGFCQMAFFAIPELLPNRWRHIGVALGDLFNAALIIVGPITGRYGVAYGTWRWNLYGAAIACFVNFVAMFFLYHPPAHPLNQPIKQVMKDLDYLGAVLFVVGSVLLLMGIVWTTEYDGADAHIVAPICVGFFFLVLFALWETYGNAKHPLTPTEIFTSGKGRDFTAPVIAVFIINMYFYSQNILWPSMIAAFWSDGGADWHAASLLSIVQGGSIFFGSVLLMVFGHRIKHWNYQLVAITTIMVLFGGLAGLASPERKAMMIAFGFISGSAFVWAIFLAIAISQLGVEHKKLGVAGGMAGTMRTSGGVIATSVYTAIITRKTNAEIGRLVPAAAIKAGLSAKDVPALMATIGTPAFVKDYKPAVVAAVGGALEVAAQDGIRLVALCSIAFGGVGIIACLCCKDVEKKMNNRIEVFLENDVNAALNKVH